MSDYFKTEFSGLFAFAVVFARQRFKRFRKSDEAYAQCSVFQNFRNAVVGTYLVGVYPYTLTHKERVVSAFFCALDFETVQQLAGNEIHLFVKFFVERVDVPVCSDAESRQVN